jgi:ribosomal protein L37AE/L43A/transposase-like protein
MGGRKSGDYPRTLGAFYRRFHDDDACLQYLVETRWPDGFRCPKCGGSDAGRLTTRRVWVCRSCRHHTSATAGTVLHRTRLPLTTWFAAAYLVASLKPGISALQLQAQLGISRYETAWVLLHKLRRAMVDPDRSRLAGTVEVDETWVGGKQVGLKGGRQRKGRKALMVVVAVERREKSLGRLRLEVIPDDTFETLGAFIARNIESGSTVVSDAWSGYTGLAAKDYTHLSLSHSAMKRAGLEGDVVPGVHRVVANLKTWLMGTHHGVGADHLDHYLNEFVFRFNRRYHPMAGFASLLGLGTSQSPTTADEIRAPLPGAAAKRRRGRSTGLTATRWLAIEVAERQEKTR